MEFKGTKGEWHAVNYAGFYTIQDEPFYGEKDLLNYDHDLIREPVSIEEAEANAQLMASAPDLLNACIEMIKWVDGDEGMKAITDIEPIIIAAIHKALAISKPSPDHSHIINDSIS